MAQAQVKVRANGDKVRLYAHNSKDEVAQALAEMEAERKADEAELDDLLNEGADCEEWPNDYPGWDDEPKAA